MEMPPWEDKGWTTKAQRDVAEKLSKENIDVFPTGVKEGIIKKRVEGAVKLSFKEHHSLGLVMMLNQ